MHRLAPRSRIHYGHDHTQKNYATLFYTWMFSIVVSVLVFSAPLSAYSPNHNASFDEQNPQISFSDFGLNVATRFGMAQRVHQPDADLDDVSKSPLLFGYQTHIVLVDVLLDIFSMPFEYDAFYWKGISSRGPPSLL